jgi:molybdopterin converting factor small subunit
MRITVRGFNETRRFTADLPPDGTLTLEEDCPVKTVLEGLGVPVEIQKNLVLFRNGRPATQATKLRDGDHLVLFAPMSGG